MPNNRDNFLFDLTPEEDRDILEREERCQKAMRAVTKAITMRIFICILLLFVVLRIPMEVWVIGLILLVTLINISGILPLAAELKKRRQEWKKLLEEE